MNYMKFGIEKVKPIKPVQETQEYLGIKIEGSVHFCEQTIVALRLLENVTGFDVVKPYITTIRESKRSAMIAWAYTFEVGPGIIASSPEYYASAIAHDGYHSYLYHQAKALKSKWRRVAKNAWMGREAEKKCVDYQLEILRAMAKGQPWSQEEAIKYLSDLAKYLHSDEEDPSQDYWKEKNRNW